jgi:hypothetical protein
VGWRRSGADVNVVVIAFNYGDVNVSSVLEYVCMHVLHVAIVKQTLCASLVHHQY